MKQFKKLLLIAVFMLGAVGVTNAQKIGHVDTAKLFQEMPGTIKMKAELEKMSKTYRDEIVALEKRLQDKLKRYEAEAKAQTQDTNAKRQAEVQQDGARVQQAKQFATQELQKKEAELSNPLIIKAQQAIKDVAAEKGLIYIFNSAPGGGLIVFDKGIDIFNAVKAKLGF
ncbi:MAG: OmpH family outer membrane protein [Flavobacteriaceae bacterium]|nr:OmpH family outer membrane protein [Flavobacteriaceae bacterium]